MEVRRYVEVIMTPALCAEDQKTDNGQTIYPCNEDSCNLLAFSAASLTKVPAPGVFQ
jgi:hypothetical protein